MARFVPGEVSNHSTTGNTTMPTPTSPFDPIGPLQLRVMNHLWKVNAATVQDVMNAVNGQADAKPLAYTTFLTVMRNLAKRRLLDQRKTATKRHQFVVLVDEESYKAGVVRQIYKDYCNNDADTLLRFLGLQNKMAG
jgi:predicted transcriptional regulator